MEELHAMKHSQAAQDYMDGLDELDKAATEAEEDEIMARLDHIWLKIPRDDEEVINRYAENMKAAKTAT